MVQGSQTLVASNWSWDPSIQVFGLTPDSSYILSIHAANERGKSEAVYVGGQTSSQLPQVFTSPPDRMPVLYIILTVLCFIMILSLILSITNTCRHRLHSAAKENVVLRNHQPNLELPLLPTPDKERTQLKRRSPQRKVSFHSCNCYPDPSSPDIQRTVVRSYSIDKLRPRCSTCNPRGDTPYPSGGS